MDSTCQGAVLWTGVYTLDPNYVVPSLQVWTGVYKSVELSLQYDIDVTGV